MKIFANCKSCNEEIFIHSFSSTTRSDLEQDIGEVISLNCPKCGKMQENHVNEVRARANKLFLIGGIALGIIVTAILWMYLGAVASFSLLIPVLIWRQQNLAVHAFNSYMVKRSKSPKY